MIDYKDIGRLASIAKIRLGDAEVVEILREMAPLFDLADSLSDVETWDAARAKTAMDVSALRDDIPAPATGKEIYMEQSPSEGGDGFVIPRLLE